MQILPSIAPSHTVQGKENGNRIGVRSEKAKVTGYLSLHLASLLLCVSPFYQPLLKPLLLASSLL